MYIKYVNIESYFINNFYNDFNDFIQHDFNGLIQKYSLLPILPILLP